jgi:hypothetical protein
MLTLPPRLLLHIITAARQLPSSDVIEKRRDECVQADAFLGSHFLELFNDEWFRAYLHGGLLGGAGSKMKL